jgi:hypothetical protein
MSTVLTRRQFIRQATAATALAGFAPRLRADKPAPDFTLTTIAGKPRERGRRYGEQFKDAIHAFLDREIYRAFVQAKHPTRDDMLRYAGLCAGQVKTFSPLLHDELEGMAEGSGLRLEELVLINLHEELWHRGVLPSSEHCTAVAIGPKEGAGDTFVGQTWDWMESVRGLSTLLHWKRPEGPSLLAYAFPGLWVGAGLNAAGVALVWTSAGKGNPRVGIPSYLLIAQMLYQDSLNAALEEARRAKHAGFFTFVLGDGEGRLANVEGSPDGLAVEMSRGRMVRHNFGSRRMTNTPEGKDAPINPRCRRVHEVLDRHGGKPEAATLQAVFADQEVGRGALDVMVFNTTKREVLLSRGPGHRTKWQRFGFPRG